MGTPDADIAARLDTALGSLTLGVNLFRGKEQPYSSTGIPHQAVFCLATGGPAPEAYLFGGTGVELRYPAVQILVRSNPRDFAGGQALVRTIRDAVHHATIAGYVEVRVAETEPNYVREDDEGHHAWTINVELISEE